MKKKKKRKVKVRWTNEQIFFRSSIVVVIVICAHYTSTNRSNGAANICTSIRFRWALSRVKVERSQFRVVVTSATPKTNFCVHFSFTISYSRRSIDNKPLPVHGLSLELSVAWLLSTCISVFECSPMPSRPHSLARALIHVRPFALPFAASQGFKFWIRKWAKQRTTAVFNCSCVLLVDLFKGVASFDRPEEEGHQATTKASVCYWDFDRINSTHAGPLLPVRPVSRSLLTESRLPSFPAGINLPTFAFSYFDSRLHSWFDQTLSSSATTAIRRKWMNIVFARFVCLFECIIRSYRQSICFQLKSAESRQRYNDDLSSSKSTCDKLSKRCSSSDEQTMLKRLQECLALCVQDRFFRCLLPWHASLVAASFAIVSCSLSNRIDAFEINQNFYFGCENMIITIENHMHSVHSTRSHDDVHRSRTVCTTCCGRLPISSTKTMFLFFF